ncbi:RNA dependent RNA polymerase-domain-containing protein [Lipomyces arxii]|uniref:RNA dependent RNA polymerase-domain-containing protein n=1 Tax=Lipomyces arxii TaxID=56418 RepID=UPI0034CE5ADA
MASASMSESSSFSSKSSLDRGSPFSLTRSIKEDSYSEYSDHVVTTSSIEPVVVQVDKDSEESLDDSNATVKLDENLSDKVRIPRLTAENDILFPVAPKLPKVSEWRSWPEVRLKVWGVPSHWTLMQLYEVFEELDIGTLCLLEIPDNGKRFGYSKVGFRPPPSIDIWSTRRFYTRDGVYLRAQLELPSNTFYVTSPTKLDLSCIYLQTFKARRFSMGYMLTEDKMNAAFETIYQPVAHGQRQQKLQQSADVSFEANLDRKSLKIKFQILSVEVQDQNLIDAGLPRKDTRKRSRRWDTYQLHFRFEQLQNLRLSKSTSTSPAKVPMQLSFEVEGAPAVFNQVTDMRTVLADTRYYIENYRWRRSTTVPLDQSFTEHMNRPLDTHVNGHVLDPSHWTTYVLDFSLNVRQSRALEHTFKFLASCGYVATDNPVQLVSEPMTRVWRWLDDVTLAYPVRYQLEVCISHNWLHESTLTSEFITRLGRLPVRVAVVILEKVADRQKRIWNPMTIFDSSRSTNNVTEEYPNYCAPMRKAQITPTAIVLTTPMLDITNRVIREYIHLADRFIRVQFSDELSRGKVGVANDADGSKSLFDRVYRALKYGFYIGDRHYEYLASGNSQLRDHGAWFFASNGAVTADEIRNWMGSFSDIKVIAKNAARHGQCFSTTRALRTTRPVIEMVPDIERNGYCFTDGIGKMSPGVAQIIASEILIQPTSPAAVQFRLGGYKGMIALWPDVKGFKVELRGSQRKFESKHNILEIVRCSSFASSRLNRQLIAVMSALGIPDELFMKRQESMLGYLNRLTKDADSALYLLTKNSDENGMNGVIADMLRSGFMNSDTFVKNILDLYQAYSLKMLKQKAKIWIPEGAFVMGVCDEYAILRGHVQKSKEDKFRRDYVQELPEIFLQITDPSDPNGTTKTIITGTCILSRNPSLHPGDIRVVNAVNKPELRHLFDVVVLPVTGSRDVASMASGGDLDGDDYTVIWDKELIPKIVNYEPMDYTAPTPRTKDANANVTVTDRMGFMIDYMKNDQLGVIALSHLAIQDSSPRGVMDPRCITLAQLHSMAVDFAKTGVPATIPRGLLRSIDFPHYMDRKRGRMRHSRKVLGKLYDAVQEKEFKPKLEDKFDGRLLRSEHATLGDAELASQVAMLKLEYDGKIRRMMQQRGIETEFEVFTGYVLKYEAGGHNKDYKYWEEIMQQLGSIIEVTKNKVYQAIEYRDHSVAINEREKRLKDFVVSAYALTREELIAFQIQQGRKREKRKSANNFGTTPAEADLLHLESDVAVLDDAPQNAPDGDDDGQGENKTADFGEREQAEWVKPGVFISFPWIFHKTLCSVARSSSLYKEPAPKAEKHGIAQSDLSNLPDMLDMTSAVRSNRNRLQTTAMMRTALETNPGLGGIGAPQPAKPFSAKAVKQPNRSTVSHLGSLNLPQVLTDDLLAVFAGVDVDGKNTNKLWEQENFLQLKTKK